MRTDLIKNLARLGPSLLLALLAFFLFQSARKLKASADQQIVKTAQRNAALFQQDIRTRKARLTESFGALTTSPGFVGAWDHKEAIALLHEINSITRFLERTGSAEQVILQDRAHKAIVNLSAAETRLPEALAETPGDGGSMWLSEAGDLFLLSAIEFAGTSESGILRIWQSADPETIAGVSPNDLWATITLPKLADASALAATVLRQPENSTAEEWDAVIERRQISEVPCLILKRDGRLYAGAALAPLTLHPTGETRGLVWLSDLTEKATPIYAAGTRCIWYASALLLLAIIVGILLLKNGRACREHQKKAESRQIELEGALTALAQARSERDEAGQKLADTLALQTEWHESRQLLQARVNASEAAQAELQALVDTLTAELDERPAALRSAELDKAYTTIAELKGLLEQCNSALTASHKELNESLVANQELEQRLETARKDVMRQEELMLSHGADHSVLEAQIELLKKQNEELEARIMGLQQAYMTTLEEFQAYREEFEIQQWEKKPASPMPPQMEFNLGAAAPIRPHKEIELPPIVNRLNERLVARKSSGSVFNLRKVCEKAIASQERDAHRHGLELALRLIPGSAGELAGDPVALDLLLSNLLRFNSLATSDGFVAIEASVDTENGKDGELVIRICNNGCSRSLHPWTNWVANPHQADCHENEIASAWCAQLIHRLGGCFEVDYEPPNVACRLILPVQLTRTQGVQEAGPFKGETAALLYHNLKRGRIVAEQLEAWGLHAEVADSVSEVSPAARVLIIDESLRQSEDLGALAEENPELPILLGDINRSEKFLKQLMAALGYEPSATAQPDLFG